MLNPDNLMKAVKLSVKFQILYYLNYIYFFYFQKPTREIRKFIKFDDDRLTFKLEGKYPVWIDQVNYKLCLFYI